MTAEYQETLETLTKFYSVYNQNKPTMIDTVFTQIYALQIFEILRKNNHTSDDTLTFLWNGVEEMKEAIQIGIDEINNCCSETEERIRGAKEEIKCLGGFLNEYGGEELMSLIFEIVVRDFDGNDRIIASTILDRRWNNIGKWKV